MSYLYTLAALALTGALLLGPANKARAVPVSPGLSRIDGPSVIELVQDRRNLTAYKFAVACPAFTFAVTRASCSANGKNREDARAKCQSQYVLCEIRDANR